MQKINYDNINYNEKPFNGEKILLKSVENVWYQGYCCSDPIIPPFEFQGKTHIASRNPDAIWTIEADFHDNDMNFRNDYFTHWADLPT